MFTEFPTTAYSKVIKGSNPPQSEGGKVIYYKTKNSSTSGAPSVDHAAAPLSDLVQLMLPHSP
jgi:hypothetical protein